jgi:2-polyprenyl-6-methoxyphenol hydroxylase-like FAD-dependent oxidoreductase
MTGTAERLRTGNARPEVRDREPRRALVLGAGMAGLFAARVLSERYERVTLIDRDPLPAGPGVRRGVPQARHVHGFQARGVEVVEELFPGLVEEMVEAGASRIADLSELHFRVTGHLLSQKPMPIAPMLLASRPYLEYRVRTRLVQRPEVRFRDCLEVAGLMYETTPEGAVVTGVRVVPPGGGAEDEVPADLVVDATGRGSRTPVWLEQLNYERPIEERIAVRVGYASQTLHLDVPSPGGRFVIEGRTPDGETGVALFGCERGTWTFTVLGAEKAFPDQPTREWMLDLAEQRLPAWAMDVVRTAEPLGAVAGHRHPASVRRRYDLLDRMPDGLVVVGDAVCAFNPIYGQGMSVAADEALALRAALAQGTRDLARRTLAGAEASIVSAWELAAGVDLTYPEVEGDPSLPMRIISRYVNRVLTAAEQDPEVARRFMAVAGLVAPRTAIFHPRVVGAVLRSAFRRTASEPAALPAPDREVTPAL